MSGHTARQMSGIAPGAAAVTPRNVSYMLVLITGLHLAHRDVHSCGNEADLSPPLQEPASHSVSAHDAYNASSVSGTATHNAHAHGHDMVDMVIQQGRDAEMSGGSGGAQELRSLGSLASFGKKRLM